MRSLHTDVPLGSERSSGSAVRFPVRTTRLMLVAATASNPFSLFLARLSAPRVGCRSESRAGRGRDARAARREPRSLRGSLGPRGGAEHLVPVRRADPEAAGVVLEVVAHVAFAQHSSEPSVWAEAVQVVVHH